MKDILVDLSKFARSYDLLLIDSANPQCLLVYKDESVNKAETFGNESTPLRAHNSHKWHSEMANKQHSIIQIIIIQMIIQLN